MTFGKGTLNKILLKAMCFISSATKNLSNLHQNKNNKDITDKTTLVENTNSIIKNNRK